MATVKLTKKVKEKGEDGKEAEVEKTCVAEKRQVELLKKHGWKVVGEKEEKPKTSQAPAK